MQAHGRGSHTKAIRMTIEIDQSGKIESTSTDTVIAFSNHAHRSIYIKAREKRMIQELFRESGKPRVFIYKLFAILVFLALKDNLGDIAHLTIDTEYPGWEHLIKDYLLREIRRVRPHFDSRSIAFAPVGKKSPAHALAYRVYRRQQTPNRIVSANEILRYLVK